jgi:hypothetical protein
MRRPVCNHNYLLSDAIFLENAFRKLCVGPADVDAPGLVLRSHRAEGFALIVDPCGAQVHRRQPRGPLVEAGAGGGCRPSEGKVGRPAL